MGMRPAFGATSSPGVGDVTVMGAIERVDVVPSANDAATGVLYVLPNGKSWSKLESGETYRDLTVVDYVRNIGVNGANVYQGDLAANPAAVGLTQTSRDHYYNTVVHLWHIAIGSGADFRGFPINWEFEASNAYVAAGIAFTDADFLGATFARLTAAADSGEYANDAAFETYLDTNGITELPEGGLVFYNLATGTMRHLTALNIGRRDVMRPVALDYKKVDALPDLSDGVEDVIYERTDGTRWEFQAEIDAVPASIITEPYTNLDAGGRETFRGIISTVANIPLNPVIGNPPDHYLRVGVAWFVAGNPIGIPDEIAWFQDGPPLRTRTAAFVEPMYASGDLASSEYADQPSAVPYFENRAFDDTKNYIFYSAADAQIYRVTAYTAAVVAIPAQYIPIEGGVAVQFVGEGESFPTVDEAADDRLYIKQTGEGRLKGDISVNAVGAQGDVADWVHGPYRGQGDGDASAAGAALAAEHDYYYDTSTERFRQQIADGSFAFVDSRDEIFAAGVTLLSNGSFIAGAGRYANRQAALNYLDESFHADARPQVTLFNTFVYFDVAHDDVRAITNFERSVAASTGQALIPMDSGATISLDLGDPNTKPDYSIWNHLGHQYRVVPARHAGHGGSVDFATVWVDGQEVTAFWPAGTGRLVFRGVRADGNTVPNPHTGDIIVTPEGAWQRFYLFRHQVPSGWYSHDPPEGWISRREDEADAEAHTFRDGAVVLYGGQVHVSSSYVAPTPGYITRRYEAVVPGRPVLLGMYTPPAGFSVQSRHQFQHLVWNRADNPALLQAAHQLRTARRQPAASSSTPTRTRRTMRSTTTTGCL